MRKTTRLLRIWQVNMSNAKRKQIALKIAQKNTLLYSSRI
jgi:hypothetical protein